MNLKSICSNALCKAPYDLDTENPYAPKLCAVCSRNSLYEKITPKEYKKETDKPFTFLPHTR